MPIYTFVCPKCGSRTDEILPMAKRDDYMAVCMSGVFSRTKAWTPCGTRMEREMVYSIRTLTNEASVWPQYNNALFPDDPKTMQKYREKGWLVTDPRDPRGEVVKVESEAHFRAMCKEQKLKPSGDYEKLNRSGPSKRKQKKLKDRPDQKRGREKAKKALRERGIGV